ncbi:MAG: PRC-barrel domain-containing protein [Anaerolineales bacterium]|jgi:sporulation protein YlmC with PRC-barrel domain
MDISVNATVYCSDGVCGKTIRVIIDPIKKKLTHIVVQGRGLEAGVEQLVPIEKVKESTADEVHLTCSHEEFLLLDSYYEYDYLPGDNDLLDYDQSDFLIHPYVLPNFEYGYDYEPLYAKIARVPHGELGVRRGAKVHATDGEVGKVDEFLVSPDDHLISHLVLREGHFLGKKLITIPVSEISRVKENQVFLKLDKQAIRELPSIPLRKR